MSAMIWDISETRVLLLCDTLASDPTDLHPRSFTTKAFAVPHLNLVISGTGVGPLGPGLFTRIIQDMVVRDIVHLDEFAPASLSEIFASLNVPIGITGTVYTFGWADDEDRFVSFAYRSTNNFASERLQYGLATKPAVTNRSVMEDISSFDDLLKVMRLQKSDDRAKPRMDRVGIGGEIIMFLMQREAGGVETLVKKVARFEDFDRDWELILAKLPENTSHPFSQRILAADP